MTLIVADFMTIGPFSQAARPNDNAASQSLGVVPGLMRSIIGSATRVILLLAGRT
jgi:hypothetical protein